MQNSKAEILNSKKSNSKLYDLEGRLERFTINIRAFFKNSKIYFYILDDIKQVIRSSGSVGANYIEANDSLSKKDFVYRIRICKKEAKETLYWLRILSETYLLDELISEANELKKILGAIYNKSK